MKNIKILENCKCGDCGWPIIDMCCNDQMEPFSQWDWWQYCSNKSCKNHFGEGVFQNEPDFIEHFEVGPSKDEFGYQLLDTRFVGGGPKSPLTYQDGFEERVWFGGGGTSEVPKMISECPHCQGKHVWYTTGLWPGSIKCNNCGKSFTV